MTELENPYAGQGPVLLDIGGAVGALVVTMPAWAQGLEVELRPAGEPDDAAHDHHHHHHPHAFPHVAVVARPTGSGPVHSLVYPAVLEGSYALTVLPERTVAMTVTVRGAEVTYGRWPEAG